MAWCIIHLLIRQAAPRNHSLYISLKWCCLACFSVNVSLIFSNKYGSPKCVPDRIVKHRKIIYPWHIILGCQKCIIFCCFGVKWPSFSVKDNGRVYLIECFSDFLYCLRIYKAYQIESETVYVVFSCPIHNWFHNIFSYHDTFRCNIITTCRSIRIRSVKISRHYHVIAEFWIICVIIHNIHYHTEPIIVQTLHHLLKFFNPYITVIRIWWIWTFRNIIILRIISPVVLCLGEITFINGCIIKYRWKLQMCDSKFFHMVKSGCITCLILCTGLRHSEIFSLGTYPRWFVYWKISYMCLIYYCISIIHSLIGIDILIPSVRIRTVHINNHRAVSVYADCLCIRITGLGLFPVAFHRICIIHSGQILCIDITPYSAIAFLHGKRFYKIIFWFIPAPVKINRHSICHWSPYFKCCCISFERCSKVITCIWIFAFKILCWIKIRYFNHKFAHSIK